MKEKWRIHPRISNLHVGNLGNFKQVGKGTIRSTRINKNGYRVLCWRCPESEWWKTTTFKCSTLTAETWLGPRAEGLVISHINEIRTDDRACNLKYVTQSENEANKTNRSSKGNHRANRVGFLIATEIREKFKKQSLTSLAKEYNRSISTISKIISNKAYYDPEYKYIRSNKVEKKKQHETFKKNVTKWSKLTPDDVKAIRVALKQKKSHVNIAAAFGVNPSTIDMIAMGERWKWVK